MVEYMTTTMLFWVAMAVIVAAGCVICFVKFLWCLWHDIETKD